MGDPTVLSLCEANANHELPSRGGAGRCGGLGAGGKEMRFVIRLGWVMGEQLSLRA